MAENISNTSATAQPRVMSILDAAAYLGICRGGIYKLAASGQLPLRKIGNRSIILREDLDAYLDGLPVAAIKKEAAQ